MNGFFGYGRRVSSEDECPGKRQRRCRSCPMADYEEGKPSCGAYLHYKDETDKEYLVHYAKKTMQHGGEWERRYQEVREHIY